MTCATQLICWDRDQVCLESKLHILGALTFAQTFDPAGCAGAPRLIGVKALSGLSMEPTSQQCSEHFLSSAAVGNQSTQVRYG